MGSSGRNITLIDNREMLAISMDTNEKDEPVPVLFYKPDTTKFDHFHIMLDNETAFQLHKFLDEFLFK